MERNVESINPSEYGPMLLNKLDILTQFGYVSGDELERISVLQPSIHAEYFLSNANVTCSRALTTAATGDRGRMGRDSISISFSKTYEGGFAFRRSLEVFIKEGSSEISFVDRRTEVYDEDGSIIRDSIFNEGKRIRQTSGDAAYIHAFQHGELGRKSKEAYALNTRPLEPDEFSEILRVLEQIDPRDARPPEYITVL